jgi:hypothetical protein
MHAKGCPRFVRLKHGAVALIEQTIQNRMKRRILCESAEKISLHILRIATRMMKQADM